MITAVDVASLAGSFAYPTRIEFGVGKAARLAEYLDGLGAHHPLIVTDAGLVKSGVLGQVTASLRRFQVFDGVEPNPTDKSVYPGLDIYRAQGCDAVVGLGGGSSLDAAKAIRLLVTHDRPLAEFDDTIGGGQHVTANLPPMVAIATTAGTGSEVARATVITLNGRKTVIFSPHLIPSVAVADAALTVGLPPHLTAYTGADALTHNVEAYLAKGFHPIADALALRGIGLCAAYLRRAVKQGDDLEARSWMLMASMLGAMSFQKGLGATHSLAHPLSAICGLHHGLSNAIMLPHVLEFNRSACETRMREVAGAFGSDDAVSAIGSLLRDIQIPQRLSEVGVRAEHIAPMVAQAVADGCHADNPRPCRAEDFERLYRAAL